MPDPTDTTAGASAAPGGPGQPGASPEDVVRRLLDLLVRAENRTDMEAIVNLWAPDGGAEFPFAIGDAPTRLEGREAVRAYLAPYPEHYDVTAIPEPRIHRTADPETVVVEFTAFGRSRATGRPYEMAYIAVVTVRDGAIAWYRDYWNPVQVARVGGGLADFVDGLRTEVDSDEHVGGTAISREVAAAPGEREVAVDHEESA